MVNSYSYIYLCILINRCLICVVVQANNATGYVNQIYYSDASCASFNATSQNAIACGICYETGLSGGEYSKVDCGRTSGNPGATVISYTDQTSQTQSPQQSSRTSITLGCQPGSISGSYEVSVSDSPPNVSINIEQTNTVTW